MGHRQKGKSLKRKRSWHRRGAGPDRAYAAAIRILQRAIRHAHAASEEGQP